MRTEAIAVAVGVVMFAGLPSYALAGWQESVPHDFVPQSHHRMRQYKERQYQKSLDAPRTTGSVKYAPRRPAARQPTQPGRSY